MPIKLSNQATKKKPSQSLSYKDPMVQQFIRYAKRVVKIWDALDVCEDIGIRDTSKLPEKTAVFQEQIANYGKKFLTKKLFEDLVAMKPFAEFEKWEGERNE